MTQFEVYSPFQRADVQDRPAPPQAHPPVAPAAVGAHIARGKEIIDTTAASLAHFSALLTWVLGPAVIYALAPAGSFSRRQAARSFNFQVLTAVVATFVVMFGGGVMGFRVLPVMILGWVGWVILTILGGIRAAQGEDWASPVHLHNPIHVLAED